MPIKFNRFSLPSTGSASLPVTAMRHMQAAPEAIREDRESNTLIIPMVAIREGVFQCVNCPTPEFYPAAEFGRYPDAWNDRMVTIDHPRVAGRLVSAGTEGVWEQSGIGRIRNARLDGKKLKVEAHIDMVKASEVGSSALELIDMIVDGKPIDVSIAAFIDAIPHFGSFEGKNFAAVQTNYVPDHVAILPAGTRGACSFEDGCGVPRVNEACTCNDKADCQCSAATAPAGAELGDTNRREMLNAALAQKEPGFFFILAVFDDHVVYRNEREQTLSRGFLIDEETGTVTLSDEVIEGTIVSEFMPITVQEEDNMDRQAAVDQLIASQASPWHEDDRTFLMDVDDGQFEKLTANSGTGEGEGADPQASEPTGDDDGDPAPATPATAQPAAAEPTQVVEATPAAACQPMTAEDYIQAAPEPIRTWLGEGMATMQRTRAGYIKHLTASGACPFSKDDLENMRTDDLRKLVEFSGAQAQPEAASNYAGQAPMSSAGADVPSGYRALPTAPAWPT